ncbi:PQQ-like beta-propeller repeat protein [Mycobacterium koreense]|uniref:Pyrrolo-quinoline quinone n=1 Tax=Mycolicibacillus koreensis TaxID=1069220 RepID=A0A7I7SCW0_9MYCO|nr:PQQ-binding-like beta-propeller repeat protein [Mycolicibacillus koreensis]MCV7249039.1 PQQ-like beta-propeller repeat protein [Mycolicibacillus koreensis]OSC34093.1 pyrrolo-quinoline quinone [Mycolicibacillus koreensis]BBY54553.1 hypothetical protein MKOR_18040 [Mycolicibacillus koreensis]
MLRRFLPTAAALVVTLAGCTNTDSWVEPVASAGWSAPYADAANSSYTETAGASALALAWTRSVKGDLGAGPALSETGYLGLNAQTDAGCSLMQWEDDNAGRQRWCLRLAQGGGFAGVLFDKFDNLYVGEPGQMLAFPITQWVRWRQPVIGMPTTPRMLDPGRLLVVTHLGQVLVFDAHRGTVVGTPLDLVEGVAPTDPRRGLGDCARGGPACPVAAPPAFDAGTNLVVLNLWEPGADAPVLAGLRYHPGGSPQFTREWASSAVGDGALGAPVFAADGQTVYVTGRDEQLWALDAADGSAKWSAPLGFAAQTPPAVSPDGVIVAGGGPQTDLVAIRDDDDHGEPLWRRDDVTPLATAGLAGDKVAYTVVDGTSVGPTGLSLLVFDPGDGRTLNSYPLPEASGFPVGVAVGSDRSVVTATSAGQVYSFAPTGS